MSGGRVVVTCSWLIHCPTIWTFFERSMQPFKGLLVCLLNPTTCVVDPLRNVGVSQVACALKCRFAEWVTLVRCSALCGVEVTRLKDCKMRTRNVFNLSFGDGWDSLRIVVQTRLTLQDTKRGIFIEIPGELHELQKLAKEIAMRQSVDDRASAGPGEQKGVPGTHAFGIDPRNMTLTQCYQALGLNQEVMENLSAAESRLLLRRAFRRVALSTHPDKVGDHDLSKRIAFERAVVGLQMLQTRLNCQD